ncbi:unnamed protein product [Candidula unifasciata]|uniref:Receptor protein-tyrosine kinase n=1 Tax=Candidula unifasciata TaxID=100452 RepID=A0A8S3YPF4_9EUPU|nr:unnamed protein product [Candidula unifasciata]
MWRSGRNVISPRYLWISPGCTWIALGCPWMIKHPLTATLIVLLTCLTQSLASSCGDAGLPLDNPKDGACGDMDIRNSVKNFRLLENCTVIEGSLHISLIDYVPQEEYDKYSFPLLREITGHLMMFRVFGLRTLRNLFPNLTAIRGQSKFFKDFALVAYEMRDLEELGLMGLTMVNGLVRLTKNHRLCHISTIDWASLAPSADPSKHLFVDNREEQLCPDFCHESCPSTTHQDISRKRCWSPKPHDCQRNLVCNCSNGRPCAPDGSCCHELCLGGCSGTTAADCYVCTHVVYNNECLSHSPFS